LIATPTKHDVVGDVEGEVQAGFHNAMEIPGNGRVYSAVTLVGVLPLAAQANRTTSITMRAGLWISACQAKHAGHDSGPLQIENMRPD